MIGSASAMAGWPWQFRLSIYFSDAFGVLNGAFGDLNGAATCNAENLPLSLFHPFAYLLWPVVGHALSRLVNVISTDNFESEN